MSLPITDSAVAGDDRAILAKSYNRTLYRMKELVTATAPWIAAIYQFNRSRRSRWVARLAAELPPGSRVIDIGAGSCPFRDRFAHCAYVAHDVGKLNIDLLQGRDGYGDLQLVSDITKIPAPTASFDAVLCTEVIEHVPDPVAAIKEMARLLRPGGRLFLTAPLRSGLHQLPFHFYGGFTPEWYKKFLKEAGFTRISIQAVCGAFNAYGEEGLRIGMLMSPFSRASLGLRLFLFPLWLLFAPWLMVIGPVVCAGLDQIVQDEGGTTGYLVHATRDRPTDARRSN